MSYSYNYSYSYKSDLKTFLISPRDHILYDNSHKNELKRWKLETQGNKEIIEAIAPKNKVYDLETREVEYKKVKKDENKKLCNVELKTQIGRIARLKGIPKKAQVNVSKKQYLEAVLENKSMYSNYTKIKATDHVLETVLIRKRALTGIYTII